jgi:hypothetical protein
MGKHTAKSAGLIASAAAGTGLAGATAALSGPVANLGGYAVTQMVAGSGSVGPPCRRPSRPSVGWSE